MPFEITPVVVGSGQPAPGLPAEPVNTTTFAPTPATTPPGIPGTPPSFLQWKSDGVALGEPDVLIVDFRFPLIATRGVGEHENVITVRRADPLITRELMAASTPLLLGGELIEAESIFYTSILYPFIFSDEMSAAAVELRSGYILTITSEDVAVPAPALHSGTLVVTIAFLSYTNWPLEEIEVATPALQSGTLVPTIAFISYGPKPEAMEVSTVTLQSGTLVVTINYIDYINWPTEEAEVSTPTLQSGTLV